MGPRYLEAEGTRDAESLVHQGQRFLDAGADLLMIGHIQFFKRYVILPCQGYSRGRERSRKAQSG